MSGCVRVALAFDNATEVSQCYQVGTRVYCFYATIGDTNGSSWDDAREFCATRNASLPTVTDENIDSVFQQFLLADAYGGIVENSSVWLDLYARYVNNSVRWHWTDGRLSGRPTDTTATTSAIHLSNRFIWNHLIIITVTKEPVGLARLDGKRPDIDTMARRQTSDVGCNGSQHPC